MPKFWGSINISSSIFFGSDSDNAFSKTKNDECDLKVNRFQKWIQAFWTSLNQNSVFSRSNNIHHFPHHYKEMLQLGVCDMPILLLTFFHINDQHVETFSFRLKSEYSPMLFFPVISRLKCFALMAIFLFFSTWFPMSWLFSHITIVKRRKNLLFILYAWRKQISVLICFFLFRKLIFLSFNWSSMRNSVWHCTDTNHVKQGQTIRMTVNEWHPHSVLNLRGKKNSKLNPQLPFGHVLFNSSFFFCEASICLRGLLLN